MDLHISSLGTLVTEGSFMQQSIKFTEFSDTQTHTHTQHIHNPGD